MTSAPAAVAIPHDGKKPDWLEDSTFVCSFYDGDRYAGPSSNRDWNANTEYFLCGHHWAAPVLAAGLTPWNYMLQGDTGPEWWTEGRVMLGDGSIRITRSRDCRNYTLNENYSVIGYEPAPANPPTPSPVSGEDDLLLRLRAMYSHRGDGIPTQFVNPDGEEAAARIEALIAATAQAGEVERETLESIRAWAHGTFGVGTLDKLISRAGEEWDELQDATTRDEKEVESADVIICLLAAPGVLEAVRRKMAINRARRWNTSGDGVGYHVKGTALKGEG